MEISPSEVAEMLEYDPHMLLVDVRTREEFEAGHIPGAGCFPVEELTDCLFDQVVSEEGLDAIAHMHGMEYADDASILVFYCDSGNRSAKAVQHLEALGYVNAYDMGGLCDWPYDLVTTDEERAALAADAAVADDDAAAQECGCGCGHDHGGAHDHGADAHACGCGCDAQGESGDGARSCSCDA